MTTKNLMLEYRRILIVLFHAFAVMLANILAFYIRFEGRIPPEALSILPYSVVMLLVIRFPLFSVFGLYRGLWRYAGMIDLQKILLSTTIGSALFVFVTYVWTGHYEYPRSVVILDWLLVVGMVGGVRFAMRSYRDLTRSKDRRGKRILVIGAGNAGEMIVRDMKNNPYYEYDPVGFIDDDTAKKGHTIHGVPILGTRVDIPRVLEEYSPEEIILAIPSASHSAVQSIMKDLHQYKLPISTLPNLRHIIDGSVSVDQIRKLELEDLLERPKVEADMARLLELISGKSVMVTGAGGSIGSELCRQVADLGAKAVVAYERHENSLYNIEMDFKRSRPNAMFYPIVGDINDMQRVEEALDAFRPDIIFHAAAHKHVPMMELNPREAIKNNVLGTRRVALLAEKHGVGAFVFISTDKAVNPTSVMGATKRACELVVSALADDSKTMFITVRFGNVLGSSGSVVPLFREQIKRGGPVTVTHPDINRFLMMIPEAVQLVLQAASIGEGGEIFVLDMGEPIKIVDLARNLIMLSGFEPDKDIKIEYVGLRPGEKLYEELFDKSENVATTSAEKVMKAVPSFHMSREDAINFGQELEELLTKKDTHGLMAKLIGVVKTYTPETDVGFVKGVVERGAD